MFSSASCRAINTHWFAVARNFGPRHPHSETSCHVMGLQNRQRPLEIQLHQLSPTRSSIVQTKGLQELQGLPVSRIEFMVEPIDGFTHLLLHRMTREIKASEEENPESYPLTVARGGVTSIPRGTMPTGRFKFLKDL
ncbi:hypothetical protein, unlikely [Trypanosoma congolense IL3000]|uniref:Uncharacterized protein n=1 Tax=Trypanosoma congolense (strain IL3000) TaxID=1068625 RepID=F9WGM9_TRYCI|nr:hypothetical protein, unlikely [Trypanosoma congolense IL3000]